MLLAVETDGHSQPGPPVPAVSTCSGTWCQLRSCGKHCVYCWHKYPWGCGGPTWDFNGNRQTIEQVCTYFGFENSCRRACTDHPPCKLWTADQGDEARAGIGPDTSNVDANKDGAPPAIKQDCIMPCTYTGDLPTGCRYDSSCPQAH